MGLEWLNMAVEEFKTAQRLQRVIKKLEVGDS